LPATARWRFNCISRLEPREVVAEETQTAAFASAGIPGDLLMEDAGVLEDRHKLWPFLPAARDRRRAIPAEWHGVDSRKSEEMRADRRDDSARTTPIRHCLPASLDRHLLD